MLFILGYISFSQSLSLLLFLLFTQFFFPSDCFLHLTLNDLSFTHSYFLSNLSRLAEVLKFIYGSDYPVDEVGKGAVRVERFLNDRVDYDTIFGRNLKVNVSSWLSFLGEIPEMTPSHAISTTGFPFTDYFDELYAAEKLRPAHIRVSGCNVLAALVDALTDGTLSFDELKSYLIMHVLLPNLGYFSGNARRIYSQIWSSDLLGHNLFEILPMISMLPSDSTGPTGLFGRRKAPHWLNDSLALSMGFLPDDKDPWDEVIKTRSRSKSRTGQGVGSDTFDAENFCLAEVSKHFNSYIEQLYIKLYVSPHITDVVLDMTSSFAKEMGALLAESEWVDAKTRVTAMEKLSAMEFIVAGRKIFEVLPKIKIGSTPFETVMSTIVQRQNEALAGLGAAMPRDSHSGSIWRVNAAYTPMLNNVVLYAGLFNLPAVSLETPALLNIARYGWVIGHEISHGFDNSGRLYGPLGDIKDWWSPKSEKAFGDRAKCLVDQYSKFKLHDIGFVNGTTTLGENIADASGLKLSYRVFKSQYANTTRDALLPGVYTDDQLYFVTAAQMWCDVGLLDHYYMQLKEGIHSPPEFRVRGAFSNFPKVAEAFHCSAAKYPKQYTARSLTADRCEVW